MFKRRLMILTIILLIVVLPGCKKADPTATVQAPAYAAAITETMLQALNFGDYQSYRLAFNEEMSEGTSETVFNDTRSFFQKRIGTYKSKKLSDVKVDGTETTVTYKAKFSQEPADVTVTIIFQVTGDNIAVSDFWLNSPKLWEN